MNAKVKAVRDVLIIGCGGVLGQLAAILCTPVLTRLYGPSDYGQWALLMSLALIPGTIATMRYELAVLLPASDEDGFNVCALCAGLASFLALLVGAGLYLLPDVFLANLGLTGLRTWFWAIPVLIVTKAIHQASLSWFTRVKQFLLVSLVTAMMPLTMVVCQISLPFFLATSGSKGLIYGSVVAHCVSALAGCVLIARWRLAPIRSVSWRRMRAMLVTYRNYPLYMTPYTLTSELRNRLAVFFFSAFSQTAALGFYVFSERMMRVSVTAVTSAMRPVFFQRAASSNMADLESPILRSLTFINRAATPFFVLFWFSHSRLYDFVFGPEWRGASIYGVLLSVPVFVLLHSNWLDRGMDVLKRQRAAFLLEFAFSVLSIAMLAVGIFLFQSVFIGVLLQCCAIAVYNAVWLAVFFKLASFDVSKLGRLALGGGVRLAGWAACFAVMALVLSPIATCGVYLTVVAVYGTQVVWSEWQGLRQSDTHKDETAQESAKVLRSAATVSVSSERRLAG